MRVDLDHVGQLTGLGDVAFDFGVSQDLRAAFGAAATRLAGQRGARGAARTAGGKDFSGYYAGVFASNGVVQLADLDEIVTGLRLVTTKVAELERQARAENKRRAQARQWAARMAGRGDFHKWVDEHLGLDEPPVPSVGGTGATAAAPSHSPRARRTPAGGGGPAGGRSAARPDQLSRFAAASRAADGQVAGLAGTLEGHCASFSSACRWAHLDASGVISGLRSWLTANGQDAAWAATVGAAFARAGGSGATRSLPDAAIGAALRAAGVAARRTDIVMDPPIAYGSPPTSGYSDDPVNAATGNFVEPAMDVSFEGGCACLGWSRLYNSMSQVTGALGPGWACLADSRLIITADEARWVQPDGRHVIFPRQGAGWGRATGENLWLHSCEQGSADGQAPGGGTAPASGTGGDLAEAVLVVSDNAGGRWWFTASGRPVSESRGAGTRVWYEWSGDGRLAGLVHERGRRLDLVWDGDRIVAVACSDGRRIGYRYDDRGRLVEVSADGRLTAGYRYDERGLLAGVVDADGVTQVANVYDGSGRVTAQTSAFGRQSVYSYLPGRVTVVTDPDGGRGNTWVHDGRGRLIGVVDDQGRRQSASWDQWGNQVLVTDRGGATTARVFDERGRLVAEQTPSGARIDTSYDDQDRVTRVAVTSEPGTVAVTTYEYDGAGRNPSTVTDPEGGVTRIQWADGLPVQVTDPAGVTVSMGYDPHGDLVAVRDAAGNVARLERDAAGRVIGAVTPLGHRTGYRYNTAGLCDRRVDPDGAIWGFEYTPAGRLAATIDPEGGRVETAFSDAGAEAATTDEIGRTITRSVDDLGNLARVELPDGSWWDLRHDAASQLTGFTDGAGGRWGLGWDGDGALAATTDPTGVQRSVQRDAATGLPTAVTDGGDDVTASYDRLGRIVAETRPDGTTSTCRYDLCGRLVEQVDPTGGVTTIAYDPAGRVIRVTEPSGAWWGYEYDACGRRAATISTGGRRYEFVHDADGRIAGEVWPTGEQVTTRFDVCGRPVWRREPGAGVTRLVYDKCGRVAESVTAQLGRRRFGYDGAGQLVTATDALGHVTTYGWDEAGRLASITDPLGHVTRRGYDPMGRLVAQTDPLGRATRYTYDAAGRLTGSIDPDGHRLAWGYDQAGRPATESADGRLIASFARDFAGRSLTITEPGGAGETVHRLVWDAEGRLISRARDGRAVSWSYDADGRRVGLARPGAAATSYLYDGEGDVAGLQVAGLGRADIDRDEIGRVTHLHAEGLDVCWSWVGGRVAVQTVTREGATTVTRLARDEAGRVTAADAGGAVTRYSYDGAGQLAGLRGPDGMATRFTYDGAGRLTAEATGGAIIRYVYDAAGQLTARSDGEGTTVYRYDGAGRRVRQSCPDGSERLYGWDGRGNLASVTLVGRGGDRVWAHRLDVDALGELSRVDETSLWWDTGAGLPQLVEAGGAAVETAAGVAGVAGTGWSQPGWGARATGDADPWAASSGLRLPDLHGAPGDEGVRVTAAGQVGVGGLEVMGARLYDPAARGFLSPDPVDGPAGAAWAGGRFGFAGNDPVGAADPWGLSPVTAAQLAAYADQHRGGLASAWHGVTSWWGRNWQYVAAGAMIAAGVVLIASGAGAGLGAGMLIGAAMSGGISAGTQYVTTGRVDWRRTAVDTAIGGIAGLAGGGAGAGVTAATAGRASVSCLGRNMLVGAAGGMADGGVSSGLSYLTGPGPHTAGGMAEATGAGAGLGGVTGAGTGAIAKLTGVSSIACFVAGTPVVMADGTTTPIEQVKAGDRVQAWNPDSGRFESRQVVDTYAHQHVATWRITTSDGEIVSTGEHPFHVQDHGWTPVKNLQPGDVLHGHDGATVTVESVGPTGATATVHNLHVAGLHTYQITTTADTPTTVHNSCRRTLKPADVRFSQRSVNGVSQIEKSMTENGWKGEGIDVVTMPDGKLTSVDNTRVLAAKRSGIDIAADVHAFDEKISEASAQRFTGRGGSVPKTWGKAVYNRIAGQGATFSRAYPNGSPITGWNGN